VTSGKMDQMITFQRQVSAEDGIGGTTRTWANFEANACVWAEVKTRVGREVMVEGRMTAQSPTTFRIYNRDDVTELDRIVWGGEAYQIRNIVRHGGRKLFLEIDAQRGAAQ
jgi:SPP1 family predicted phage head-tail adaptor